LDRLRDPKLHMRAAAVFVVACVVGWPLSLVLTDEPPLILSLSWLALIIPAIGLLLTAKVEKQNGDEGS
jgi:hypothetical protein